jgi:hypothetical protein
MAEGVDAAAPEATAPAWEQSLETLRLAGGARLDPVRFRYIELLARRMGEAAPEVRARLLATLERALAECAERVQERAAEEPAATDPSRAGSGVPLQPVAEAIAAPPQAPLAELNRYISAATEAPARAEDYDLAPTGLQPFDGLKNAGRFRESWQRMCAEDALEFAEERAPEAAGPLNSRRLMLHSMKLMQELSPGYLRHFIENAETLLWLDKAAVRFKPPPPKPKQARSRS